MPDLPQIEQVWIANVSEYVAAMGEMLAATEAVAGAVAALQSEIDALHGKTVDIGIDTAAASAAAAVNDLAGAEYRLSAASQLQVETSRALAEADRTIAATDEMLLGIMQERAATTALVTRASESAVPALVAAAAATDAVGGAATRAWRPWFLFGNTWQTALHWIVAGSAEFLAVAIPAVVALAAGLLVAAQGAQNVQQHFQALYAATESTYSAFHQTVGSVVGLGSALQAAQNAANPGVYEILGSAINAAKSHFADFAGAGLQVVHMFDEFAARVNVDLRGALGVQLHNFLATMVTDLQQAGQVLGNFGHALINVFAAMPGLVHVLLSAAVAISQFVSWLSRAPAGLLTFGIAMEEVFRWGGLLLGVMARLAGAGTLLNAFAAGGGFITRFGAAIKALVVQGGLFIATMGEMAASSGLLGGRLAAAGAAVDAFGMDVAVAGEAMSTAWIAGITLGAAAVVYLTAKLASMKSATEAWIAASDQAVASASDLNKLPVIYNQLAGTSIRLADSQKALAVSFQANSLHLGTMTNLSRGASQSSVELANHLISLVGTANQVRGNINLLAGAFHISAAGAVALANAAGVNLQQGMAKGSLAMQIAVQQINNLRTGLGAMGAPIGVIGADMQAMGVQSQLASSKVGQVNQAMDQFIGTTTGGMNAVMQFNAALTAMGHDTTSSSQSITGAINSISHSAASMGYSLAGIGPRAQQSWQQFDAAVQQGNSVLDTMRIGMAEGVVSASQYSNEIRAVGGALLPFAANNKTALAIVSQLAQEMGMPATTNLKTLAAQFGVTGKAAERMGTVGMEKAIAKMANLNTVARNLSVTVGTQLDSAMAGAIVKASHLDQAYSKWANDLKSNKGPQTLAGDLRAIQRAQDFVNTATQKGTGILNKEGSAMTGLGNATSKAASSTSKHVTAISSAVRQLQAHITMADRSASATGGLASKTSDLANKTGTAASKTQTAAGNVQHLGSNANTSAGQVRNLASQIQSTGNFSGTASGKISQVAGAMQHAGAMAATATGQVRALAAAIASLQSKTITITTNFVTTGTPHRQHGGPVAPNIAYMVGEAGPELFVPKMAGMVIPHSTTEQVMNIMAGPSRPAPVGAPAAGGGPPIHVHLFLDGKEISAAVRQDTYRWQTRNAGVRSGLSIPGTRIG